MGQVRRGGVPLELDRVAVGLVHLAGPATGADSFQSTGGVSGGPRRRPARVAAPSAPRALTRAPGGLSTAEPGTATAVEYDRGFGDLAVILQTQSAGSHGQQFRPGLDEGWVKRSQRAPAAAAGTWVPPLDRRVRSPWRRTDPDVRAVTSASSSCTPSTVVRWGRARRGRGHPITTGQSERSDSRPSRSGSGRSAMAGDRRRRPGPQRRRPWPDRTSAPRVPRRRTTESSSPTETSPGAEPPRTRRLTAWRAPARSRAEPPVAARQWSGRTWDPRDGGRRDGRSRTGPAVSPAARSTMRAVTPTCRRRAPGLVWEGAPLRCRG